MKEVWQLIDEEKLLVTGDYVLVGVSGGPDSVALLHILWQYSKGKDIQLHIVHLNHQLRGSVADEETAYVQNLAEQLKIPYSIFSASANAYAKQYGLSLEQAGHELRFQYFQQVAQETGATKLALGHHKGDKVETMLLNLLRGCGPEGLTAMPLQEGWLIRPLLLTEKAELVTYCQEQQLSYYIDASNGEPDCLRNKIRLELLPLLEEKYNPQVKSHLLQLAEISEQEQAYLEKATFELWQRYGQKSEKRVAFPLAVFREQTKAIQRRLLRFMYAELKGDNQGLFYKLLENMLACAATDSGEKKLALPGALEFYKSYNEIACQTQGKDEKTKGYAYSWQLTEDILVEEIDCIFSCQSANIDEDEYDKRWYVTVDKDALATELTIRSRKVGDYLQLVGMEGRKKLKEFMIDRKIPASERDKLPLILAGEEIIWIPGYFLAKRVRITEATRNKAYLICKKEKR